MLQTLVESAPSEGSLHAGRVRDLLADLRGGSDLVSPWLLALESRQRGAFGRGWSSTADVESTPTASRIGEPLPLPPPPPPPRRGRESISGLDGTFGRAGNRGGCATGVDERGKGQGRATPLISTPTPTSYSDVFRGDGDEDDEEKDSAAPAIHRAIAVGRERAVALAEIRLASARAAGATSRRLVELLGDLAAAHAGVGVGGVLGGVGGGERAPSSLSTSSPPPPSFSFSKALARALSLLDPRDVGDWRASKPSALAALASGSLSGAAAASATSSKLPRSPSSSSVDTAPFSLDPPSSCLSSSCPSPSSSAPSAPSFDPRELRVRLSVGPSRGTTVSLAEMLTKPPSWFVETMSDFGASVARVLGDVVRDPDPAAVLRRGPWLSSREGQRSLREAAKLFSQLRAFSPVWCAADLATALESCALLGCLAPEEEKKTARSSSDAASLPSSPPAARGKRGFVDDGDDSDDATMRSDDGFDVEMDGEDDGRGERTRGAGNEDVDDDDRDGDGKNAAADDDEAGYVRLALDAIRLTEEQRRGILGLRRDYLRARRSAAIARARAVSELRSLLLLPPRATAATAAGGDESAAAATPPAAPPPANDIGRDAYARALRAAASLSAAAAADADAEVDISVRISSIVTRAQGGLYNAIIYPRPHRIALFAELLAEEAGEAPAEAVLAGAVVV